MQRDMQMRNEHWIPVYSMIDITRKINYDDEYDFIGLFLSVFVFTHIHSHVIIQ